MFRPARTIKVPIHSKPGGKVLSTIYQVPRLSNGMYCISYDDGKTVTSLPLLRNLVQTPLDYTFLYAFFDYPETLALTKPTPRTIDSIIGVKDIQTVPGSGIKVGYLVCDTAFSLDPYRVMTLEPIGVQTRVAYDGNGKPLVLNLETPYYLLDDPFYQDDPETLASVKK